MTKQSTAAIAALFASFFSAANVNAQIVIGGPCGPSALAQGPHAVVTTNLKKTAGEELMALGIIIKEPEFPDTSFFQVYGNKPEGGWTIVETGRKSKTACIMATGEKLEIAPPEKRGPGLPVSMQTSELGKIEQALLWGADGDQHLQLTGQSPTGQFRLYANTDSRKFTLVLYNADKDTARIVLNGEGFIPMEKLEEKLKAKITAPKTASPGADLN